MTTRRGRGSTVLGVAVGAIAVSGAALALGCSCNCFVAGTRVLTPGGSKSIDQLRAGDIVFAFSHRTGELVERRVGSVLRGKALRVARVRAGEACIAGATMDHPFWDIESAAYVKLGDLRVGTELLMAARAGATKAARVDSIELLEGEVPVWNLSVEGEEQNFFAEGVLVHNKSAVVVDTGSDTASSAGDAAEVEDARREPDGGER